MSKVENNKVAKYINDVCKLIKNIVLGGSILALSIAYVGCSHESSESTLDKDTLIVGMDDAFAPMGFKDESG